MECQGRERANRMEGDGNWRCPNPGTTVRLEVGGKVLETVRQGGGLPRQSGRRLMALGHPMRLPLRPD